MTLGTAAPYPGRVGLFRRLLQPRPRTDRDVASSGASASGADAHGGRRATVAHLNEFVGSRVGVEAYVEPPTRDTRASVLLVATTGEWTRRGAPDERAAWKLAEGLGVPVYNVQFTGYPQRYRDWNSRARGRRLT